MRKNGATAALIFLGLLLIAIGIRQGQPTQIMAKAIRICLECVGIG